MTIWAILGSLSIPILIGIYFLRNRYPEKKVSSLLLWDFPELKMRKGINRNKFISERSFWMELLTLILFMLVLFQIAMPFLKQKQHIVYVLDNRYSLQAQNNSGVKIYEKIINEIISESKGQQAISVILADQYPRLLVGNVSPDDSFSEIIKQWKPSSMSFDWQLTKVMLTELSDSNSRVIIYSDRVLNNQSEFAGFELRLRGNSQDNFAFINGSYSRNQKSGRVQALIKGIAKDPAKIFPSIKIKIKQDGFSKEEFVANIENKNIFAIDMEVPDGNKAVEIQLPDESLVLDNTLHFEPAPQRKLRVNLQIQNNELHELMLKTIRIFDDILIDTVKADVYITDHYLSTIKLPQILLGLPANFTEGEPKDFLGNTIMQKDFALMKDMQPNNIRWRGCKKVNTPVISYLYEVEFPLFGKIINHDQEVFFWNADLVKSDFRQQQDWPIFWDNFRKYFFKNVEGIKYSTLMGGVENYFVTNSDEIDIVNPNQKLIKINTVNRLAIIPPFMEKGIYQIKIKEKEVASFFVNYFDLDGMDLTMTKTDNILIEGNKKDSQRHFKQTGNSHVLIMIILLLAILIYCVNLFLDHREGKQR
jgi:hypothetical protein